MKRRARATGPSAAVVAQVCARDGRCVRCGYEPTGARGYDWSLHHRLRRSQGGTNTPENLVVVCGHGTAGCHWEVHAGPALSRHFGWLVRRGDDPDTVPVFIHDVGWVLLTGDGQREPVEEVA